MSSSIDFSEYSELVDESSIFSSKATTKPEDEFFHAVYISGQVRKNHLGVSETPGKLQIRGLRSNLDEVNLVITHVKNVLVKSSKENNREKLECFSYQLGPYPWKSTSGNICGKNSTERAAVPFCSSCRAQLIIAGIYIDETTGKPFLVDGKGVYVFIRARGIKYGNLASYLSDLAKKEDLDPIVTPVTEESKKFEREQVNHKRFVTKITIGQQSSSYGMKDVFEFQSGAKLSVDAVKNILNKSKATLDKFKEKFDWSQNKTGGGANYSTAQKPQEDQMFNFGTTETTGKPTPKKEEEKPVEKPAAKSNSFSFEDVNF